MKRYILLVIPFFLFSLPGCHNTQWQKIELSEQWPEGKVESIDFVEVNPPSGEVMYHNFSVPADKIDLCLQYLKEAVANRKPGAEKMNLWEMRQMRIITTKGRYIVIVRFTDKLIRGADWESEKLKKALKEWGFSSL